MVKEYTFISVPVDGIQAYLTIRGREGYVLITQLPSRKEMSIVNDKTIEETTSLYITMEREAAVVNAPKSTPAADPKVAAAFDLARKAVDRFGAQGPQTEADWKEFEAMGGTRPGTP
jgi:hypothetical protein